MSDIKENVFENIYQNKGWGTQRILGIDRGLLCSGKGSHDKRIVGPYISSVKGFLDSHPQIRTAADIGCGDFNIGSQIFDYFDEYNAYDISKSVIEQNCRRFQSKKLKFKKLDICEEEISKVDVVFVRQVFQHLSNEAINLAITQIRKKADYLIVTEHLPEGTFAPNKDIETGQFTRLEMGSGVDLEKSPFNLRNVKAEQLVKLTGYGGVISTMVYQLNG